MLTYRVIAKMMRVLSVFFTLSITGTRIMNLKMRILHKKDGK